MSPNKLKNITTEQFLIYKKKLHKQGEIISTVVTGSMEPLIPVGSKAVIKPYDFKKLQKYDIIIFLQRDKLICHFVWHFSRMKKGELITKSLIGGEDMPICKDDFLGIVDNFQITTLQKLTFIWKYIIKKGR